MKLQGPAILIIAFLFLTGYAHAATQLNTSNGTGWQSDPSQNIAASHVWNVTSPLIGTVSSQNSVSDIQSGTITRPTHLRPTETIHPVPPPKILRFDYTKPSACAASEGGEDEAGGDAGGNVSIEGAVSNSTDERPESGSFSMTAGDSGGSFGGSGGAEASGGRVPDCLMRSYMLELVDEPAFVDFYAGPDNDLHHPNSAVLLGLTPGQYHFLDRQYGEEMGFIDYCYDTNPNPYWVWVEVDAEFQTMIARPRAFDTTLYVNSHGAEIPVISTVETLYPDQMYTYTIYIPVKCEQVQDIDSMKLDFKQIA